MGRIQVLLLDAVDFLKKDQLSKLSEKGKRALIVFGFLFLETHAMPLLVKN